MIKKLFVVPALWLVLTPALLAQSPSASRNTEESKLRFAATQHEIISIMLQEKEYAGALSEFRRILGLGLEQEMPLVQEAWLVANQLIASRQYSFAHQVIDDTLEIVETPKNRFTLLMLKGKLYKEEGRTREAVRVYREAQKLQETK
jgi:tetratricopeptide (TPR) repeat protein